MDRETFMHNVSGAIDIQDEFFNLMVLYCLYRTIGSADTMNISKIPSELASFNMAFGDADYANHVSDTLNGSHISLYGDPYNIQCESDGTSVCIKLK